MRVNLNGTWGLRWYDGSRGARTSLVLRPDADMSRAIEARVPGEVHADLLRAGIIAEPVEGMNNLAARWVQETLWLYRRTFVAPEVPDGARALLTFEGLDLAAVIYLNGREIGRHGNSFYPCTLDVTSALVRGENLLIVEIESGVFLNGDRPGRGFGMSISSQLTKRNWMRKIQSSFGWDWAPQLLNVGITRPVHLDICAAVFVQDMVVIPELSADLARGRVTLRAFIEGIGKERLPGLLSLEVEELGLRTEAPIIAAPGKNALETTMTVEAPELWWPVGHGSPKTYTARATLSVDGELVAAKECRIGFRHVKVNQDPHPVVGSWFVFEINGKSIFAKGGNFVPADPLYTRIDRDRYSRLVKRAREANFNLLRVWGGGQYEAEDFYDLCDEHGILVWQDFIFACCKYPTFDENYLADVTCEATFQVRRLAHHASLIAWCGNNEMEEGNHHWGYEKGVALPDYALFHLVLPSIVRREDGTRYWQPSSPFTPDQGDPRDYHRGDQHPWTIGGADTDFRGYRAMDCRFPNEGGILGPNSLPTVRACLPAGHERPGSMGWEMRDNDTSSEAPYPDRMLEQWLGKSLTSMSLDDYVYWAGLLQGEGLSEYIRNFRRRMFHSSSAIFWMFNDCWPMVRSWTIVDHYLRRTPSFHPVRRAFLPLTVFLAVEEGRLLVFGVNEGPAWRGELRYGLFRLSGGYPMDFRRNIELPANASTLLAELDQSEWTNAGIQTHGAFAQLSGGGQEVARDVLFLPFYKEMEWPHAQVRIERSAGKAVFTCDTFAWRVCLDLDGEMELADNFFDILPGIPTTLSWPQWLPSPRVIRLGNP